MKDKPTNPKVKIAKGLALPEAIWEQLTKAAEDQYMSRNALLESIIRDYLKNYKPPKNKTNEQT